MKRDAIILFVATVVLTILAYNGRPMEKADLTAIYAVADTELVMDTEMEAVEVREVKPVGFVMYSPIWDKVQMTFYTDGSCIFEMSEYHVAEQCTWTYEEGVLCVMREDGKTFISYMAEDRTTLKLDYEAMAHEQLIGQMSSTDYKSFFENQN